MEDEVRRMVKRGRRRVAFVALWRALRASREPGTPGVAERVRAVPRMVAARARGSYQGVSWGRLVLIAAAFGYLVSPVDLVPELLLTVPGLLDDVVVAAWAAGALLEETRRYLVWEERSRLGVASAS